MKLGGGSLLTRHGSLTKALKVIYPEHKWVPWRFSQRTPHDTAIKRSCFSKTQYLLLQYLQNVHILSLFYNEIDVARCDD